MRIGSLSASQAAAAAYTTTSLLGAGGFLAVTLLTGDYGWTARLGGALWVFLLMMIIQMPTVTPWIKSRWEKAPPAGTASGAESEEEEEMGLLDRVLGKKNAKVKDPVCGMEIDAEKAAGTSGYQGETYYFCSAVCKKEFDSDPEKYVGPPGTGEGLSAGGRS